MSSPLIRLLVVDDHPIVRAGVCALVNGETDMQVVAEAKDGEEAFVLYCAHRPDVTIMDLQMGRVDGITAISRIRDAHPEARILVLTTYSGDFQAVRALRAGACGYLLKTMIRTELFRAIRAAHAGLDFVPPSVLHSVRAHEADNYLSAREITVLRTIASSGRNKSAAAEMGLTENTVKVHMKNILAKLGATDRVQRS